MERVTDVSSGGTAAAGGTGAARFRLLRHPSDPAPAVVPGHVGTSAPRAVARDDGILPVAWWLRLEGVATLALGIVLWGATGGDWIVFAVALLAPDLGMIGYLAGPRWGAFAYDLTHNLVLPAAAVAGGIALAAPWLVLVGALLIAHAGTDRALGYGLKYATGFRDTHLQRV